MRVDVYWNLHKDTFSIRHKGKVIGYSDTVCLENARFVVRDAARRKVVAEHVKSVHAWVQGDLVETVCDAGMMPVTYNPYRDETFVYRDSRAAIATSTRVRLATRDNKPWVTAV